MNRFTRQSDSAARARETIARFETHFGEDHLLLACHAAIPLVLTPELLNYLRTEFLLDRTPWVAEADLLLSELCREIGYESYAMDAAAREILRERLDSLCGPERKEAVARRVFNYINTLILADPDSSEALRTQRWEAMVYLPERRESAVAELRDAINAASELATTPARAPAAITDWAEIKRFSNFVRGVRAALTEFPDLLAHARAAGTIADARAGFLPLERLRELALDRKFNVLGRDLTGLDTLVERIESEKRQRRQAAAPRELIVGEVVRGIIEKDRVDPRSWLIPPRGFQPAAFEYEPMAVPVRAVINLGEAGMGIAPITDFLLGGVFRIGNDVYDKFEGMVDLEFDFIVTHEKDTEGFYGLSRITRHLTSTWGYLMGLTREGEVAIGRLIEVSPEPVVLLSEFRATLPATEIDNDLHRLLNREIPVAITAYQAESHSIQASFQDALHIETKRRSRRAMDELVEDCVVEGRAKLTLDKESHAVDLGGVIGRLPHDEVAWLPENPQEESPVKIGERMLVKVIEIDRQQEMIRLSRKQLLPEPMSMGEFAQTSIETSQLLAELQQQQRDLLAQVWRITETQREIDALDAQSGEEWERLNGRLFVETSAREAFNKKIEVVIDRLHRRQTTPPSTVESFLIQTLMSDLERFGERRDELWTYVHDYLRAVESNDAEAEVRALADIARIFSTIEELPPAITLYRFAAERADERQLLELDIYDRIASCHERMGNLADAETYYEMALNLAMARPAELKSKQLHGHRMLGNLSERTDRFDKALDHFNYALHLAGDLEDNEEQVSILTQIASVHLRRGDRQRLIDTLQSALKIARTLEDKDQEARVRTRLGHAFLDAGEFRTAVEQYGTASELSQDANTQLSAFSGLAHAQFRQGHWGEADTFFRRTLRIAESERDEVWIATTLDMLGLTHLEMEDYRGSLEFYERALRMYERRNERSQTAGMLARMGRVHTASGDAQNAFDCYRQAALIYAELGERGDEAATSEACARALESLGQRDDAIEFATGALELYEQIDAEAAGRVRAFLDRLRTPPASIPITSLEAARKIADPDQRAMALRDAAVQLFAAGEVAESKAAFDEAIDSAKQIKGWIRRLAAQRQINAARNESGVGRAVVPPRVSSFRFENVTFDLVEIPGGEFLMGSNEYGDEKPVHRVKLSPYFIGKVPVTQAQWRAVMGSDPSRFKGETLPVEKVSWDDAVKFCETISAKTGKTFRLPTEAEWEMACRAGSTGKYCFGDDEKLLGEYAWYDGNSGSKTHPVGRKKANAWGLFDMHGNVWEWCADWYDGKYYAEYKRQGVASDPQGSATGSGRVARGGGWSTNAVGCRSAGRGRDSPGYRIGYLGFRLVRVGP